MNYKHNPELTNLARILRKNMTKQEKRLWYDYLCKSQHRFLRQKVIDDYIVDFYCAKKHLVIELDGSQHYNEKGKTQDSIRTESLEKRNLTVIRIPNNEIDSNFDGVCEYLDNLLKG